jgi:hypothetical protein
MLRSFQRTWAALLIGGAACSASAYSMMGPFEAWQLARIGYQLPGGPDWPILDIAGPMNLGQEYRWNLKPIYYGFDNSFKMYFGARGCEEVRKAIAILNSLPAMSKMRTDLSEFSTDTRRVNYRASALGLIDLKSQALGILMGQLGVASPERWTWCLRARIDLPGGNVEYHVIKRSFDPVTKVPSSYVNDTLYTYNIIEFAPPSGPVADAVELPVDPLSFQFTAVASAGEGLFGGFLLPGDFFTGLSRDDVGALRALYAGKGTYVNNNIETLVTDVNTNGAGGGAWTPVGASRPVVSVALRPGMEKLVFKEAKYDSTLGSFIIFTNYYKDTYVTNGHKVKQTVQRVLVQPDIIFGAADMDISRLSRTGLTNWVNNAATNAQVVLAGPGVIQPPIFISFNNTGPLFVNWFDTPSYLDEQTAYFNFAWGSFDGSTNEPVVYPVGYTIQELEMRVLGGR